MDNKSEHKKYFEPLSQKGWPVWAVYLIAVLAFIYLLNPTAGIIEFIPDNIPFIGNVDEGVAAIALWYGVLELLSSKKH